jgi:uncharacterized protein with GYD domain
MPVYILLSKLTAEGRKTIRGNPLGPYDFVNIVEAPDNKTVVNVSVELGARGTVEITTLPTIPLDEFVATAKGT